MDTRGRATIARIVVGCLILALQATVNRDGSIVAAGPGGVGVWALGLWLLYTGLRDLGRGPETPRHEQS